MNPKFPRRLDSDGVYRRPKARSWSNLPSPQQERKKIKQEFRKAPEEKSKNAPFKFKKQKGGCGCRKNSEEKTRKWGN